MASLYQTDWDGGYEAMKTREMEILKEKIRALERRHDMIPGQIVPFEMTQPGYVKDEKTPKKEKKHMEFLKDFKKYLAEHKSAIYTLASIWLLDRFFLEGKLTAKIQDILDGVLNKAKEKLTHEPEQK